MVAKTSIIGAAMPASLIEELVLQPNISL